LDIKSILKSSVAVGALVALAVPAQDAYAGSIKQAGKLDLKVGGRVVKGIAHVDDGVNDHTFIPDGVSADTELYFSASGKLTEAVTAGLLYKLNVQQMGAEYEFSNDDGDETVTNTAQSVNKQNIYFKHSSMGTLSMGYMSQAGDGASNLKYGKALSTTGGFARQTLLRDSTDATTTITAAGQISNLDQGDDNVIRYDSPSISGFTVAGSFHDDGGAAAALRYSGSMADINFGAAIAYRGGGTGTKNIHGSVRAQHASGLHLAYGGGMQSIDGGGRTPELMRLHGGFESSMNSFGKTDIYVTYIDNEDVATAGREGNEVVVGVTQGLDAIGGYVGLAYSTTEVEDNTGTTYQDVDVIYLETQVAF
jgi:hypothetical protein